MPTWPDRHDAAGATVSLQYQAASPSAGSSYSAGDVSVVGGYNPVSAWRWFANAVTTTPQDVTLPSKTTGWTADASFAQFNPSLGTLDAIIVSAANTLTSTFAAENLSQLGGLVSMNETASVTVATPGDGGLTASVPTRDWFELSGYDGTTDFSGTSGQTDNLGPCFMNQLVPSSWTASIWRPFPAAGRSPCRLRQRGPRS